MQINNPQVIKSLSMSSYVRWLCNVVPSCWALECYTFCLFSLSPVPFKNSTFKCAFSSWVSESCLVLFSNFCCPLNPELSHAPLKQRQEMLCLHPLSAFPSCNTHYFFLVCFFSGDRWHLGGLRASWWPAKHTETWLMREASNSQKCEWCHHSFFLWGLMGFTVPLSSSTLRWCWTSIILHFIAHYHLFLVHLCLEERNLCGKESSKAQEVLQQPGEHRCCWGLCWAAVFWQYLSAALDSLLWSCSLALEQRLSAPLKYSRGLIYSDQRRLSLLLSQLWGWSCADWNSNGELC